MCLVLGGREQQWEVSLSSGAFLLSSLLVPRSTEALTAGVPGLPQRSHFQDLPMYPSVLSLQLTLAVPAPLCCEPPCIQRQCQGGQLPTEPPVPAQLDVLARTPTLGSEGLWGCLGEVERGGSRGGDQVGLRLLGFSLKPENEPLLEGSVAS